MQTLNTDKITPINVGNPSSRTHTTRMKRLHEPTDICPKIPTVLPTSHTILIGERVRSLINRPPNVCHCMHNRLVLKREKYCDLLLWLYGFAIEFNWMHWSNYDSNYDHNFYFENFRFFLLFPRLVSNSLLHLKLCHWEKNTHKKCFHVNK